MTQLTFDLPTHSAFGRADYLVCNCNAKVMAWIDRWPDWPSGASVLYGPAGCGKTHLAHLWCERASAVLVTGTRLDSHVVARLIAQGRHRVAVDDGDRASEHALLHLHNFCLECGGHILITTRRTPASWGPSLPDLTSRLRAAIAVGVDPPDDTLLGAVLAKHFCDRQLFVAPQIINYLVKRIERSFAAAADIAARLDAIALRNRSAVTLSLARTLVRQGPDQPFPPASDAGVT